MPRVDEQGEWPISEVIAECPVCGSSGILWNHRDEGYFVECNRCMGDVRTDYYAEIADAIEAWNEMNTL